MDPLRVDVEDDPLSRASTSGEDDKGKETEATRTVRGKSMALSEPASRPLPIPSFRELQPFDTDATPVAAVSSFPQAHTTTSDGNAVGPSPSSEPKKPLSISQIRAKTCKAAAAGDMAALLAVLHPDENDESVDPDYPSSFALVNSPTSSGLTALLEAAQHGHLHIVQHLIEEEGAVRDFEDIEGENAFLKAAYRGHLEVMQYLAEGRDSDEGTEINASDREGWTALHNAAGKGYLEIVMWLCQRGAVVDARSQQGYTPLMNAASKGHLPIVSFFLQRQLPDPFIRNAYQETAYDVAVATFELGIADALSAYESRYWQEQFSGKGPYNPLAVHTTVPIVVYENQRLDLRWYSRAGRRILEAATSSTPHGKDARFRHAALSKRDGHAAWELPPTYEGLNSTGRWISVKKSDLQLPSVLSPYLLRTPPGRNSSRKPARPSASRSVSASSARSFAEASSAGPSASTALSNTAPSEGSPQSAWYFLSSSFFVDLSPANISPDDGWQYAKSFVVGDEEWSADVPPDLGRLLAGAVPTTESATPVKWVRRRRWARVMRRRIDIHVPGFSFADIASSSPDIVSDNNIDEELKEVKAKDYLDRAKYYAGSHMAKYAAARQRETEEGDDSRSIISERTVIGGPATGDGMTAIQARKMASRLERAVEELRHGIAADFDASRCEEARSLLSIFTQRLLDLREEYPGVNVGSHIEDEEDEFHYPESDEEVGETSSDSASISTSLRSTSIYSPNVSVNGGGGRSSSLLSRQASASPSYSPPVDVPRQDYVSISHQLQGNAEFRLPMEEAPSRPMAVKATSVRAHQSGIDSAANDGEQSTRSRLPWEADEVAHDCRCCRRKFTFFVRKHHCRKCGLVVCGNCSSHTDYLQLAEVVFEPGQQDPFSLLLVQLEGGGYYRVCDTCHQNRQNTSHGLNANSDLLLSSPNPTNDERGSPMQRSISDVSELGECPVCGTDLSGFSEKDQQESHVQACLDSGEGSKIQDSRYLVFALPQTSPLIGTDCLICFESYQAGDSIGRLGCLCHFHKHCISNWLSRGKACPVHAR